MVQYIWFKNESLELSHQQALESARLDVGFEDPFGVSLPWSDANQAVDETMIAAVTAQYVESEVNRIEYMMNLVQINPIFGPASFKVNAKSCFVMMPFQEELTTLYIRKLKPAIEAVGMSVHRADELPTINPIMHDIWKSICEARLVVADLTGLNPNVMYELGIAHTIGKDTILIYQKDLSVAPKFPFDLAHIRRIEYQNTAVGGDELVKNVVACISAIVR
jgi:hypothetical protein